MISTDDMSKEERIEYWGLVVDEFHQSGLTKTAYCQNNEIAVSTFNYWENALKYLINQEAYLREFLNNGIIPLDNSDAERSIRAFCVGKHSWHIADTSRGAKSSGILYSIAETAKANGLKPYEYFKYLIEQLHLHENDLTDEFIDTLLPWSETLPDELKVKLKSK